MKVCFIHTTWKNTTIWLHRGATINPLQPVSSASPPPSTLDYISIFFTWQVLTVWTGHTDYSWTGEWMLQERGGEGERRGVEMHGKGAEGWALYSTKEGCGLSWSRKPQSSKQTDNTIFTTVIGMFGWVGQTCYRLQTRKLSSPRCISAGCRVPRRSRRLRCCSCVKLRAANILHRNTDFHPERWGGSQKRTSLTFTAFTFFPLSLLCRVKKKHKDKHQRGKESTSEFNMRWTLKV